MPNSIDATPKHRVEAFPELDPQAGEPNNNDTENSVGWLDWAMLALAVFSVGLLIFEWLYPVTDEMHRWILYTDRSICAIFLIEFCWRWQKSSRPKSFPLRYWYEILGMIPVSEPALRGFRLLRFLRVAIVLSRLGRASDRIYGAGFFGRLARQSKSVVAEALSDVVTVQVLDRVAAVLHAGQYTQNIARVMEQREQEITEMVTENLKNDAELGLVRKMPFFGDTVRISSRVTQRILISILADPRTDELVADLLKENIQQIRDSVKRNEAAAEFRSNTQANNRFRKNNTTGPEV